MTEVLPAKSRDGRVVTFYSFKGGTGRTMALANVAWILASNGYRVLAVDWDLESPGLHRFFAPFLGHAVREAQGIIDMVRAYEWLAEETDDEVLRQEYITEHTRIQRYAIPLRHWTFPDGGALEFLSPGRQNRDYLATLSALDWDKFYSTLSGGEFLDALRAAMKSGYDYALIDSRTGLSDIADICTVHLPDVLVDCFTLSTQGVEGAAQVAKQIEDLHGFRGIRVLPVPMRVDPSEQERVQASRVFAQRRFENLPAGMTSAQRREYWANVEVPYRPYYAYEELLAVFGDSPGALSSMLSAYERLTGYITEGGVTRLPPIGEELRNRTRARFDRGSLLEVSQVSIQFLPQDQLWAEWVAAVLGAAGLTVSERRLGEAGPGDGESGDGESGDTNQVRTLTVLSEASLGWLREQGTGHSDAEVARTPGWWSAIRGGFAVYVGGGWPVAELTAESTVSLASVPAAAEAVDRRARLLQFEPGADGNTAALPRYPGTDPRVARGLVARNDRFTGREAELRDLREQLRGLGTAVVHPVALLGTAGVGKTAIALEYVHRFMSDYDLVCWIPCGRSQEIDLRVAELAPFLQERFGASFPPDITVDERAKMVLRTLADGVTVQRWLLVYDNAEDTGAVREYLPAAGGRVIITSQNQAWEDLGARSLRVRLFDRADSVAHLLGMVPHLTRDDAEALAEALGDLPVAITAVAAYLRDSGFPVARYLSDLTLLQPSAPAGGLLSVYPAEVAAAWDAPLALLRERSPASARLLELCSVMASEIALDLVYSRVMAEILEPYDPALAEPLIMGRIVQEASKLNLLTLDSANRQIIVHRVVQTVVRNRMGAGEVAATRGDVQRILIAARPRRDVDDPATWSRYRMLWPHLEPAEVASSTSERVRQLVVDRVRYVYVFSDYDRGVAEATAAAALWRQLLDAGLDPAADRALRTQLLQLEFNHGNILLAQSRFRESRELHTRVHEEQAALLGRDHPHTLMTAGSLGADLRAAGLYRDALELDRKTHPAWVGLYGEDHAWSLRAANNLAVSYRLNGEVNAALQLDRETRQHLLAALDDAGHPQVMAGLRNLARDLIECGDYRGALDMAREAYDLSARRLGAQSAAALGAQILLGIALRSLGRMEEAGAQFEEAVKRLSAKYGPEDGATLEGRLSRAVNLWALDRFTEAEEETRLVLEKYQSLLGADHPNVLVCQVNLAAILRQRTEGQAAAAVIHRTLADLDRVLGPRHPYTIAAAMMENVLLADGGDYGKATETGAQTLDSFIRTLGPGHPDTLRCRANLLLTRRLSGEDTADELGEVINDIESMLGASHPTVQTLRARRMVLRALDPQPF